LLLPDGMKAIGKTGIVAIMIVGAVLLFGGTCAASYNKLVRLDEAADAQWAQVENAYQRRADLIPNLVSTVRGAAKHERDTLIAVTEARSRVGQVRVDPSNVEKFEQYQQAQDQLGSALSRLLVVAEAYPDLKVNQNFRDLQAQLEGTENRITVERMRFNDTAREFNQKRSSFPMSLVAGVFGTKFERKAYFTAKAGSDIAPKVEF
jgi:LemA protein